MEKPFLVYGTQYYRQPTPEQCDWEHDLKNIKAFHMNTIKFYVMWRGQHPAENEFYFDDLHKLFRIARKNDLWIVVNIILCTPPAWIFRKYKDARIVTEDGRVFEPRRAGGYPVGGLPGMCYHHPAYKKEAARYLEHLVRELHSHENLLAWDTWNEPMFNYAPTGLKCSDLTCYCLHSRLAFIKALKRKYGSLLSLNEAWQMNYSEWDDVELPRSNATFRDMIDWRMFAMDTLVDEQKWRVELIRKSDKKRPLMCHPSGPSPFGDPIQRANDDWRLSELGDIAGASGGYLEFGVPMRSIGRTFSMPAWSSEVPYVPGGTFGRPEPSGLRDRLKEITATTYLSGYQGILFWQFKPERLGIEAPGYGLVGLAGEDMPWTGHVRDLGRVMNSYSEELSRLSPIKAQTGIVYSPEGMIFDWIQNGAAAISRNEHYGIVHALMAANVPVDFLHVQYLEKTMCDYKIIYLPFPNWIDRKLHDLLQQYVGKGGVLWSGPLYGQFDTSRDLHSRKVPGYGADELFGCIEQNVLSDPYWTDHGAYDRKLPVKNGKGKEFIAYRLLELFSITSNKATPLLRYENQPCAVVNRFGAGKAYLFGTYSGNIFEREHAVVGGFLEKVKPLTVSQLITGPALEAGCDREPSAEPYGVLVRSLRNQNGDIRWIALTNKTGHNTQALVNLGKAKSKMAEEVFERKKTTISGHVLKTRMDIGGTRIFRLS